VVDLKKHEAEQIAEILTRRARELGNFARNYEQQSDALGSVELALSREIDRLRTLASRVNPPDPASEEG